MSKTNSRIVFDVGNTTICYALTNDGDVISPNRISTTSIESYSDLVNVITNLRKNKNIFPNQIVACVGVQALKPLFSKAAEECELEMIFLSGENSGGAQIIYETPETLGADRIANAIAASFIFPLPVLVVDCGTAINIDYIDDQARFCGGAIIPGIETARDSLTEHAPNLPIVSLDVEPALVGTNTISCIQSGVLNGAAATIDTFINRMKVEYKIEKVILTGGNAKKLLPLLQEEVSYDEWFTLGGLASAEFRNL